MKYLLFSHGFGVRKDSRGMFTDIARAFPDFKPVMFEYNKILNDGKKTVVPSYKQQARLLKQKLNNLYKNDPRAEVIIIGHSQGCIIPGLVKNLKASGIVLLAPPWAVSAKRSKLRPNREVLKTGAVKITKKNGDIIILSSRFMLGLTTTNPPKLYLRLSKKIPTQIITAKNDEMIDNDKAIIPKDLKVESVSGDHNFTGISRKRLIEAISKVI